VDRRAFIDVVVRAPLFLSVAPAGLAACRQAAPAVSAEQRLACLQRVCYLLFPYPDAGQAPYEQAAAGIAQQLLGRADLQALVAEGITQLDGGRAGAWLGLDESGQVARLREIEAGSFFRWIYQVAVDHVYNDERIWKLIGYEGSSFEKGGYLRRGFDDIDWL
jgi:hypothetical protein